MALRHWITSLAVVAVTAAPALAQDNNHNRRRAREQSQQSQQAEQPRRAQPQAEQPRREQPPAQSTAPQRERAVPRAPEARREDVQRREDNVRRDDVQRRTDQTWRNDSQRRTDQIWRDDARRSDQIRRGTAVPRVFTERGYSGRTYELRRWDAGRYGEPLRYGYGYAPRIIRPTIVQVVPYRPYVYRPSWSIGVYYGYDGYYPYGYTPDYYFHPIPGRYYGGVRITGAPREARVFADGYFVGIVDDFDGIFQHLNLEAGPHHIDIVLDGYEPVAFDVNVRPGETITFRADGYFFQPY
jgi:PEGA domain